mgnify:FL=1
MISLDNPLIDIMYSFMHIIHNRPRLRVILLTVTGIIDVISISLYMLIENHIVDIHFGNGNTPDTNQFVSDILVFVIFFSSVLLILTICSFSSRLLERRSLSDMLDEISKRKQTLEEKIDAQKDKPHIQDIIQLNLSQLNEYYTINKSQSKRSYEFSFLMIFIGFLLIAVAVVLSFVVPSQISITLIIGVAGLLSEFIGATALNLYKESNKHVNEFLERLTYLQKVMLAIELVDRISEGKKEEQLSNIISSLMKSEKD